MQWTADDVRRSWLEGWYYFEDGELHKDDDQGLWVNDEAVWVFVWRQAKRRSRLHHKALRLVRRDNPIYYAHLRRFVKDFDRERGR